MPDRSKRSNEFGGGFVNWILIGGPDMADKQ
jgi:hypothetical protein